MLASCRGYLNSKQEFISDNEEADAEYGVNFVLASISKPILIENIFYDFDRATLRPESETSLNELVKMLNERIYRAGSSHRFRRVGAVQPAIV